MGTSYETDVVAWANEQAALLRAGNLTAIDALHIAEEIEDVGKSERRELKSRMSVLLGHLLKWKFQPDRRSNSWRATITLQRSKIGLLLADSPSLKHVFDEERSLTNIWFHAGVMAGEETLLDLPRTPIWPIDLVLDQDFWPD